MAFRRPRVNVKPNVQTSRPVPSTTRTQETPNEETITSTQDEQSTQQNEITVEPPIASVEAIANVEEIIEPLPSPPLVPQPIVSSPTSITLPPPPPSSPPPSLVSTARPIFRKKIAPNIGVKTAIHHRRPSASCSGTESESESSRQKHVLASTITFTRVPPSITRPPIPNDTQPTLPTESPTTNEEISTPTKAEATISDIPEVHTPPLESLSSQIQSRSNTKISREYLTQHITYRAQRLAAKVEPEMTIRKRRAATLEKLDETGVNKGGQIDPSKLKIADFVHYNPTANPMEVKIKTAVDTSIDPVRKHSISSTDGPNTSLAPQLKIDANGALIVDEESLYIRNMDDTPRNTVIVEGQFNDDNLTHQSYRKIGRRKRWNARDTLRFYQALRMCGTDFTLIARVFPNRDRDDIKRKFKTEDKANRTLIDSALRQRIPFDLTCFYSPSEESSEDEDENDIDQISQKKTRKRRLIKRKPKQTTSSDPLEINRRREKRLQAKKNSMRIKKSAEFIDDEDDEDENSMDIGETVEVTTTTMESKSEQVIPATQNEETPTDNSVENLNELENLLGHIDGGHLLFVHNTDETTGVDRIDVHVVIPSTTEPTV